MVFATLEAGCMPVEIRNPRFQEAVQESFSRQALMQTLGATLARIAPGEIDIAMPWRPDLGQQGGVLHAGVIASIADSACGYAALTLMPPASEVVSIEFKLNLLAPGRGASFLARGRVIRAGKTITAAAADVFGDEILIATMLATMMRRDA
ncbi:MAG TPA: PaaI family thioesterase [Thermoanaerobaculia bacterium]|nr:PaaI family thioesterase [Thermoanaerobaculia bacterium]